jgi:tetratricopeptide (TPR) repeat protein
LIKQLSHIPFFILMSYRDDEGFHLPFNPPADAIVIGLRRFSHAAIQHFSQAILGAEGQNAPLVEFLERETEGNVFFLVEVLRVLAEKAGGLNKIAHSDIPAQVFSGGILQVIQRRLAALPPKAHQLLEVAALAGQFLDTSLLQHFTSDLDTWLHQGLSYSVLSVEENRWRFSHDKLRTVVLNNLDPSRTRHLHRQIAETIITLYPQHPEKASLLAYHWHGAGDTEREAEALAAAGKWAISTFALEDAIGYLTRAEAIYATMGASATLQHGEVLTNLGIAWRNTGQYQQGRVYLEQALQILKAGIPRHPLLGILRQVFIQIAHRRQPNKFWGKQAHDPRLLKIMEADGVLGAHYLWSGQRGNYLFTLLRYVNIAELTGDANQAGVAYSGLSYVLAGLSRQRQSRFYSEKALSLFDQMVIANQIAVTWIVGAYYLAQGQLASARQLLEQGYQTSVEVGDQNLSDNHLVQLMLLAILEGDYQRVAACGQNLVGPRSHPRLHMFGRVGSALASLSQGESAVVDLEHFRQVADKTDITVQILFYGVLARACFADGETEKARQTADHGLHLLQDKPAIAHASLEGLLGILEVYLGLGQANPQDKPIAQTTQQALKALQHFARRFAIGQPYALYYEAQFHADPTKLQQALELSQRIGIHALIAQIEAKQET